MMREGATNKGRRMGRVEELKRAEGWAEASPHGIQQPGDLSVPDKGVL